MVKLLYRTVRSDPPTRMDFASDREVGKAKPERPNLMRRWEEFSTFETLEQAREKATAFPTQGAFIACIAIPDDGRITYERTGRAPGHHTVWGDPDVLFGCFIAVYRMRAEEL